MKNIVVALMVLQAGLFTLGAWQVSQGTPTMIAFGIFNMVATLVCFCINIRTLAL